MSLTLKVYVAEHCSTCAEALTIATRVDIDFPDVTVEVIDIGDPQVNVPDAVFAIPTFMLNDRIVSLGNPHPDEVNRWVEEAMVYS